MNNEAQAAASKSERTSRYRLSRFTPRLFTLAPRKWEYVFRSQIFKQMLGAGNVSATGAEW